MARQTPRPSPHELPLGGELQPTIDRLRAIAAQSGDALLLGEGPVHPDAELLDLCAELAAQRKIRKAASDAWSEEHRRQYGKGQYGPCAELTALRATERAESKKLTQLLRRASKLRATTPAGIYAKALAVRSSQQCAAVLAMGLADELLSNPTLRASLWPAGGLGGREHAPA